MFPLGRAFPGLRSARMLLGFVAGVVSTPVFVLVFAKAVASWYDTADSSFEHAAAAAATRDLTEALDRYRNRYQRVPDAQEGLAILAPEYLPRVAADPWGHPFVYQPSGPKWADVVSYGADGQPGGSGTAADVSGRFGNLGPRPPLVLHAIGRAALCLIPLVWFALAQRGPVGEGLVAGTGALWAVLLLATLGTSVRGRASVLLPVGVGLGCLTGSIGTLRQLRGAEFLTCIASVGAPLVMERLIAI